MTWPLPQPSDITDRAASYFEAEMGRIYLARTGQRATVDARSPNSALGVHARQQGLSLFDLYLYQRRIQDEVMPDTAQDWLSRHATIWGVPRDQPVAATGNGDASVPSSGSPVVVPSGTALTAPGGATYTTTAAVTIAAGTTSAVPVAATVAGTAGNLASGTVLTLVSPIAGLSSQTLVVDSDGVTGGQDLEAIDSWRTRILQRIRKRGAGGSVDDYLQWMQEVLPGAIVGVQSPGTGVVTVAFAMPGPRVPTSAELATATAYLTDATMRKPLTAQVVVIAATLTAVPVTLHLIPDTVTIRAAATAALAAFFNTDAAIGGTIDVSRLDNALSTASGEFAHDRTLPSADTTVGATALPVLGAVSFV